MNEIVCQPVNCTWTVAGFAEQERYTIYDTSCGVRRFLETRLRSIGHGVNFCNCCGGKIIEKTKRPEYPWLLVSEDPPVVGQNVFATRKGDSKPQSIVWAESDSEIFTHYIPVSRVED
jgi:hypothetical protein